MTLSDYLKCLLLLCLLFLTVFFAMAVYNHRPKKPPEFHFTLIKDSEALEVSQINGESPKITIPKKYKQRSQPTRPVERIGDQAFSWCSFMTKISIPNTIKSIGNRAFFNCAGLSSIYIPASVTSIGSEAFRGCNGLIEIKVDKKNPVYRSEGNCIITISDNTLIAGCQASQIPNTVKTIGKGAFAGCETLKNITIPSGVTTISDAAFSYCNNLISADISNTVTDIGNQAFIHCEKLTSLEIPSSVISIGDYAFNGCYALKDFKIPHTVKKIGYKVYPWEDKSLRVSDID